MSTPPIACKLTSAELQERRTQVLEKVAEAIVETREQEDGWAFGFPPGDAPYEQVVHLVNLERKCCPFLRFQVTVEPDEGPLWLKITGPREAKAFIADLFKTGA